MNIVTNPKSLFEQTAVWRRQGTGIGFVPTMGYLHEGHISLVKAARERAEKVVVSIFVNPTQFGPQEDFDAYPRDHVWDEKLLQEAGVDLLFRPDAESMYTDDAATWVEVPSLARHLCGASRPAHFRGVCTIVTKLFHLAQPTFAFFGEKDWQQLAILKRMTKDLMLPVEIIGCPIVREPDGLAMSSRNVRLKPEERIQAAHIHQGLSLAAQMAEKGERQTADILAVVSDYYHQHMPAGQIDYLAAVTPDTIEPVSRIEKQVLFAAAVKFSQVRLIDNHLFKE